MPLTPRDRRTLMIGGGILGFLLVAFFLFNNLSGGGDDGAIPTLPPITTAPGGRRWRRRNPDRLALERDQPAAGLHRSRSVLDPAGPVATIAPTDSGSVSPPPSGSTSTTPPPSGSTNPTTPPPSTPGGNSSIVLGGKTVVLLDTFKQGTRAQFEVDGTVYNVGIGDTFGGGSFELQSINGDCATFLYGDEPFTLCANSTK